MKRILLAALVVTASLVVPAGYLAGPAAAAACSGTSGVTVVVQFPDGHVEIGCALGDPSTGVEALENAGFPVDPVYKSAFVCRIKGEPSTDHCQSTPPANAYWAYYHAESGGGWAYSTSGAWGRNPKPGSVEGWRFGDGKCYPQESQQDCDERRNPPPAPKPTPSATRPPSPANPTASSTPGSVVAAPSATPRSTATGTATAAPSVSASPTGTATVGVPSAATTGFGSAAGQVPVAVTESASSGGASWIWGVALLAVVAAIGGTVAYRRRV